MYTFWKKTWIKTYIFRSIGILLALGVIGIFFLWAIYLRTIPSIESLASGGFFRESTVIYDTNGNEIYSLFKDGKRTYIWYDAISPSIIDAIISTEDRTFFTNPGVDLKWLARAWVKYLIGSNDGIKGTSTISQQLIKNTLLSNERSLKRKIQEAYLSYKLNDQYSKEKILEMYLNAISYGYNANGIEQASRTFFGKNAKDVGPLGASILASLPKWPTYYSPYLHRDRLMGKVEIYMENDLETKSIITLENAGENTDIYLNFKKYVSRITFEHKNQSITACNFQAEYVKNKTYVPGNDGCMTFSDRQILDFLGNITYRESSWTNDEEGTTIIEYTIGRKDFVASQMLEDEKIDGATFHKIFYDGLDFQFKKYAENIKYPHFVMYVKEYLESKYGKDIDITSGLKVYTTIDPKLQDKAEELVKKQVDINRKSFGADSAALVSMDNTDGKLLAMVGWPNYFDTEKEGNNNMAIALRQPGSSFKPFVYALAIAKNPIGPESPIADIKTDFGKWSPDNYDKKFNGIMQVKTALDYSRNIPAAKMFFLAGWEGDIVKMWRSFWLSSLKENAGYGWPLAIGTAEVRPIDLMQAYSVLANNGIKRDLYFISKIEDGEGNIIEEHVPKTTEESIFSPAASYIVSKILSDNNARPESSFWRNALTIAGRTVAAKTGTANKPAAKWTKNILPGDLWTAGYTPQITTVVWAWNVNGKATKWNCDGLNCAAPIWKWFMEFALKDLPKEEFKKPKDIYTYDIVKTSGKLATKETPKNQIVTTIMATKLTDYDGGLREMRIDTLCNGPISENTPESFIETVYIPAEKPIIDGYDPAWTSGFFEALKIVGQTDQQEAQSYSEEPCERPGWPGNISINIDSVWINTTTESNKKTIEVSWIWDRDIYSLRIIKDDTEVRMIKFGTGAQKNGKERVSINLVNGSSTIIVEAIDKYGFRYTESKTIIANEGNNQSPEISPTTSNTNTNTAVKINIIKPEDKSINLYEGMTFNLRFSVDIGTANREIQVLVDNVSIQNATSGDMFVIPVGTTWLAPGKHTLKIIAIDGNYKKTEETISLNIMNR
jgi:penicillin-binding protein 1A